MLGHSIGIYAGTFDPIHEGHIAFADMARRQADLDMVLFLPEPEPRRKSAVSPVQARSDAIKRRITGNSHLELLMIDQPRFTVDETLPVLADAYPGSTFSLLVGSDIAPHIERWHNFEVIRRTMKIIVGMRTGDDQASLTALLAGIGATYEFIHTPYAGVSSSQIRTRIQTHNQVDAS